MLPETYVFVYYWLFPMPERPSVTMRGVSLRPLPGPCRRILYSPPQHYMPCYISFCQQARPFILGSARPLPSISPDSVMQIVRPPLQPLQARDAVAVWRARRALAWLRRGEARRDNVRSLWGWAMSCRTRAGLGWVVCDMATSNLHSQSLTWQCRVSAHPSTPSFWAPRASTRMPPDCDGDDDLQGDDQTSCHDEEPPHPATTVRVRPLRVSPLRALPKTMSQNVLF